jgi:hypothetical protein
VSKDGQFAIATSIRRDLRVWGCLNPLGDPGDPGLPIDPRFFSPPASTVFCMTVGSNNLAATLTNAFGPDNQPYFGGRRVVNSFDSVPGGNFTTSWPNCIWQTVGALSLADAFANNLSNGCGDAQPNFGFTSALIVEPPAMISHGQYLYIGPIGGTVVQFAVTTDPFSGFSHYDFRTYLTGLSILTGLGVAEDLRSLMIYTDPTAVGLAGQEIVTKVPLCEDMLGEVVATGGGTGGDPGNPGTTGTPGPTGSAGPTSTAGTTSTTGATATTAATAATGTTAPAAVGGFVGGAGSTTQNSNGTATTAASAKGISGVATAATVRTSERAATSANTAPVTPSPLVVNLPGPPAPTAANGPSSAAVTFIAQQGLPRIAQTPASASNGNGSGSGNVGANGNHGSAGDAGGAPNRDGGTRNARGGRHNGHTVQHARAHGPLL